MLDHLEERTETMKNIREEIEAGRKQGQKVSTNLSLSILDDAIAAMEELLRLQPTEDRNDTETSASADCETHISILFRLLSSKDYKDRAKGEYLFVKDKYEKLHRMIIKREAGKLDFVPNCPMEQWKAQAAAMGQYLYQLEIKAEIEGVEL